MYSLAWPLVNMEKKRTAIQELMEWMIEESQVIPVDPGDVYQKAKELLEKLSKAGYGSELLSALKKLIDAEKSDLFDVLEYVFNSDTKPITRAERVAAAEATMFTVMDNKQREFIQFVLDKYIQIGVGELDEDKLPILLSSMFQSQQD